MYIIKLYTLNYYEDKYFISLFARFKHTVKIYYHLMYTWIIIKNLIVNFLKCSFFREQFKCALIF